MGQQEGGKICGDGKTLFPAVSGISLVQPWIPAVQGCRAQCNIETSAKAQWDHLTLGINSGDKHGENSGESKLAAGVGKAGSCRRQGIAWSREEHKSHIPVAHFIHARAEES